MANDIVATLGAVCGTGFGILMFGLGFPVWTVRSIPVIVAHGWLREKPAGEG
ncbi:hypothetical protein ACTJKE_36280 [Ensifer sp. 22521]|uniref:hypothetical protein n=1 Tax=Ensifer sp. 22521 TaxID=3453935 RepID=UPI003F856A21